MSNKLLSFIFKNNKYVGIPKEAHKHLYDNQISGLTAGTTGDALDELAETTSQISSKLSELTERVVVPVSGLNGFTIVENLSFKEGNKIHLEFKAENASNTSAQAYIASVGEHKPNRASITSVNLIANSTGSAYMPSGGFILSTGNIFAVAGSKLVTIFVCSDYYINESV